MIGCFFREYFSQLEPKIEGDTMDSKKAIGVLIFDDFELLDVFGPLEMYGMLPEIFDIFLVSEDGGNISSRQGPRVVSDHILSMGYQYDILFVVGGTGTRREVHNPRLMKWLKGQAEGAELVTSVCTGSALLAKAGVLDGIRATTNKLAFNWVQNQGEKVSWIKKARWVEDGRFFTSSGVSAGTDMSLAVIERLTDRDTAYKVAAMAEYIWNEDSEDDPFVSSIAE